MVDPLSESACLGDESMRRIYVAAEPSDEGEVIRRHNGGVVREANRKLVMATEIVMVDDPLEAGFPTGQIACVRLRHAETAAGAERRRPVRCLLHHHGRDLEHPPRTTAHEFASPGTVENRQTLHRIVDAGSKLIRPFEGGLRFRRMDSTTLQQRVRHADLQILSALPTLSFGFHLLSLCQRREQRPPLDDFRHFRARRESFERRRKDSVGIGCAAGRLIEVGE